MPLVPAAGVVVAATLVVARSGAQDAPKVVAMTPPNLAAEVDAKTTTKLVVEVDQAMGQRRSVVVGGDEMTGVSWQNPKTFVIEVRLEPDRTYSLSLNRHTFTGFRSAKGVALLPVPWSFTTLPAVLPTRRRSGSATRRRSPSCRRCWRRRTPTSTCA
jgi:hypothetical protein